jgi:Raf kinase inhibitor-like YbhB/YbcL family protein
MSSRRSWNSVATLRRVLVGCVAAAVALVLTADAVGARPKFKLTSPAFAAGGMIPDGFTCDGASASPPLQWKGVPKGTVELAITMEDPDVPGSGFVHWVAWGIDPELGRLPEETLPTEVVEGEPAYRGPCPPSGDPHHYRFTLYALDEHVTLEPGAADIDELRAAIKGTVKAKAKLVGLYARDASVA